MSWTSRSRSCALWATWAKPNTHQQEIDFDDPLNEVRTHGPDMPGGRFCLVA